MYLSSAFGYRVAYVETIDLAILLQSISTQLQHKDQLSTFCFNNLHFFWFFFIRTDIINPGILAQPAFRVQREPGELVQI